MRKTARDVIAEVAALRGVTTAQLTGQNRKQPLVFHRQEAMFEVYIQCPHLSYPAIADAFGGRDHTTAIWSVKQHCRRLGIPYAKVRRTTAYYVKSDVHNARIGFVPHTSQDYRQMARL